MSDERIREGYAPPPFEDAEYPDVRIYSLRAWDRNQRLLRSLSRYYYLVAALFAVVSTGLAIMLCWNAFGPNGPPPGPEDFSMLGLTAFSILFYPALTISLILVGRSLAVQKRYIFCLVMACFIMLGGVIGIALGISTLIVLARGSVKEMFKRGERAFEADADYD